MSKPQYKKIAFPHGGIVPAAFSRSEKDERVGPHHAVDAETTYAQTLVDDRFAYFWSKKTAEEHQPAGQGALLVEDANAKAKSIIDNAHDQAKKTIGDAEGKAKSVLDDAEAKAKEVTDAANDQAKKIVGDAEDEAKKVIDAANAEAQRLTEEAKKGGSADNKPGDAGKGS